MKRVIGDGYRSSSASEGKNYRMGDNPHPVLLGFFCRKYPNLDGIHGVHGIPMAHLMSFVAAAVYQQGIKKTTIVC
jgi:hypothetical protein